MSTEREETWGQRNSSRQGQLQAAETWAGRDRQLLPERLWEGGFAQFPAIPCSAFPRASPSSPLPPTTASSPRPQVQGMTQLLGSCTSTLGEMPVPYNPSTTNRLQTSALHCCCLGGGQHSWVRRRLLCMPIFLPLLASFFQTIEVFFLVSPPVSRTLAPGVRVRVRVSFYSDSDSEGPTPEGCSWKLGAQAVFESVRHHVIQLLGLGNEPAHFSFSSGWGISVRNGMGFSSDKSLLTCHCLLLLAQCPKPRKRKSPTTTPSLSSSSWHLQTHGSCSSCTSGSCWASTWLPSWATASSSAL